MASASRTITDYEFAEALVWISLTSYPTAWLSVDSVEDRPDMLIPEFPLTYLWWEACHKMGLLMLPLAPLEANKIPIETLANTYAQDSSTFNLAVTLLGEEGKTFERHFVEVTSSIIVTMRALVGSSQKSKMIQFYESRGINWERLIDKLDMTMYVCNLSKLEAIHTASVVAGEYLVNGLAKNKVPSTVQERLSFSYEMYGEFADEVVNAVMAVPRPGMMSAQLIPVCLFDSRAQRDRGQTLEQFSLYCALPTPLETNAEYNELQRRITELIVRETTKPLPTTLDNFVTQANSICMIATMVLQPFGIYGARKTVFASKLSHVPSSTDHVMLLSTLKELCAQVQVLEDSITIASRIEYNSTMKRMAYLVYLFLPSDLRPRASEKMGEMHWHDRWMSFYEAAWTRQCVNWLEHSDDTYRGLRLITPTSLLTVAPWMRLAWWIEDKLRFLLSAKTLDMSAEYNPALGAVCLSVLIPKEVKWDPVYTASLEALEQ